MRKHPYQDMPEYCFWKKGIEARSFQEVDPIASAPFVILPQDKVATAGSCFAQHISRHLKNAGFQFMETEPAHPYTSQEEAASYGYGIYTARYGNIYTARQLLQLFQRAYGLFKPKEEVWEEGGFYVDPFRPRIQPHGFAGLEEFYADRNQHFAAIRHAFENLDVFVFTLGLTEGWESTKDGAVFPLCPGVAGGVFDQDRHVLHNFSVSEIVADMLVFIDLLKMVNASARVILTVSPVSLAATAVPTEHILSANTYSKSVLRVACQEIVAQRTCAAYMPSYEIITGPHARGRYFTEDCRTVNEAGVAHVMRVFLKHFTEPSPLADAPQTHPAPDQHLLAMQKLVDVNCDEIMLQPAEAAVVPAVQIGVCNLCGSKDFGPGPKGRLTDKGYFPHCNGCGSLERNRALGSVLQALGVEKERCEKALIFGTGKAVREGFFRNDVLLSGGNGQWKEDLGGLKDGFFDFISLTYWFEFQEDDLSSFSEILRVLAPDGVLQVCFNAPNQRTATVLKQGDVGTSGYRLYGHDVFDHFKCKENGIACQATSGVDPATGKSHVVHFFFKSAGHPMFKKIRNGQ
ncbi:MAG: GSCFA domain-containing protein [Burkholderiaceae bacterium]|nr:GSCFA domain-containing protein [Burkholderiaceae bacterium]